MKIALRLLLCATAGLAVWAAPARAEPDPILTSLVALRERAARSDAELPAGLIQRITSWQQVPLFSVLDEREPNDPDDYTMTHPLFAFEWRDGRLLVVDAGLPTDEAVSFGAATRWLGGGEVHCDPHAWRALLMPGKRIEAVVFTHLHTDHVLGVRELCGIGPVPVRLSPEQEASDSMFEVDGRDLLRQEAPACVRFEPWQVAPADGPVESLVGFPGVYRVPVPGHTPGSQLLVGFVREPGRTMRAIAIAGDIVNHRLAIARNVAKPWWYRWFIVREDEPAQQRFRALLRDLATAGFEVLVNHDLADATANLLSGGCSEKLPD